MDLAGAYFQVYESKVIICKVLKMKGLNVGPTRVNLELSALSIDLASEIFCAIDL
jgi:hypothetical protein